MNPAEKRRLFNQLPRMMATNDLSILDDFHRRSQQSIRLHTCAHACYVRYHVIHRDYKQAAVDLWRMKWAPLATLSTRIGLNQNRRFFGLGPYRT